MKRANGFLILTLTTLALLACDAGTLIAMANPTTTPTRTPRPTFTPRAIATTTPEEPPTPEPTETSSASPTQTRRVVATTASRPATAKPAAPTAPPAPQFLWKQSSSGNQGRCDAGPGVFEIKGRINAPGKGYIGGVNAVALDKDGKIVAQFVSLGTDPPLNPEWSVSCFEEKNIFNYKLDVSAGRGNGPITLRLTRSANDLTPVSADLKIDISQGGRWYIDWTQ
ncbi:MAG: hypothetical protein HZC40_14365 [Chloroflexi bacterium]|nr:hypothetical protein [Chloroflexota bacterium]